MTRKELRWCLLYALILAGLTTLPYTRAAINAKQDWEFTGFVFAVEDGNSYIAKMRRGSVGEWLFRSPYTAVEQRGVIAFTPYLLLGKLAGSDPSHRCLVTLFHAFRILTIPLAVVATYRFIGHLLESEVLRKWGTVIATAGGGLGWLLVMLGAGRWLGSLPLDLHSPEAFGFLSFYGIPHLVLARAALLYGLAWYLESQNAPAKTWWSGVAFLILALAQPISMLVVVAAMAAHWILLLGTTSYTGLWKPWLLRVRRGIWSLLIPAPYMVYLVYAYSTDPYLRVWGGQNLIPSPHPLHFLMAYGLMLIPASLGAWRLLRESADEAVFPLAWVLAAPALAYAPLGIQRRLTDGLWVVIVALAARGLYNLGSRKRLAAALLALLSFPSSMILLLGGIQASTEPGEPIFRPAKEAQSFEALGGIAGPEDVVLASFDTSNALPAWAAVYLVVGHGPESAGLAQVLPRVQAFYAADTEDAERLRLLDEQRVDFVFVGPSEAQLGDWHPQRSAILDLRFELNGYSIYAVKAHRPGDEG